MRLIIKKIWKWLNGKKTTIASLYWDIGASIILIWFPAGLPPIANKINLTLGVCLTAAGLGHKTAKKCIKK